MKQYILPIITAFILTACNNLADDTKPEDSVKIDTLYPLPNDSNASGTDTSDHNKGTSPTNNIDVDGPVVLPKDIKKPSAPKPKSPKNPYFDTTKA